MTKINRAIPDKSLNNNLLKLFSSISIQRKLQIFLLFVMQFFSACLEILNMGNIIPFLAALTNPQKLMGNHYIGLLTHWAHITGPQQLIVFLAAVFGGGIVLANIFRFLTLLSQQYLSAAIAVDLAETLFLKTLYKPYSYFLKNNSSHLISNMTNDLNGTLSILYSFFSLVTQGLISIFVAAGLLIYKPAIAITLSIIIIVSYSLIMKLVNRRLRRNSLISSDNFRDMLQSLQEGFGGIRYIILGRFQKNFAHQFRKYDQWVRRINAENSVIMQSPKFFLESIAVLAISGITISFVVQGKNISDMIPLMGFLVFGCYRLLPAMQQIYSSTSVMLSASVALGRVMDIISEPLRPELTVPIENPLKIEKALEFQNVYFGYQDTDTDWTIDNVSFSIKPKTTVALVGHTGSGKSTIADLILGLIEPQKGQIRIDGKPLDRSNTGAWQTSISHVPQNIFLSDATISENIAFGIPYERIDTVRVHKAAEMAQISSFIQSLPRKYDETVGERGVRLSGGQRQRIGIARALYQNPSLIVFDEATSALDNKTEQDVVLAISELQKNLTIILIAHRLSTVKNADNIMLFEKGRLIAEGTYEALLSNSYFKELVTSAELK